MQNRSVLMSLAEYGLSPPLPPPPQPAMSWDFKNQIRTRQYLSRDVPALNNSDNDTRIKDSDREKMAWSLHVQFCSCNPRGACCSEYVVLINSQSRSTFLLHQHRIAWNEFIC